MSQDDRATKLRTLFQSLLSNEAGRDLLVSALKDSGLAALRQVEDQMFTEVTDPERIGQARAGILLDTETTGVDHTTDKVIQLAMRKFTFDGNGILSLGEVFNRYRDPLIPIPEEVTKITRITDDMVRGQAISDEEVAAFCDGAELVLCHNSAFDRKMLEANFPRAGFQSMAFDCSLEQIDWLARGRSSAKLELLALAAGYVYGSHDALNDINVMPFILNQVHGDLGTPFAEMRAQGEAGSILLIAQGSPFDKKDDLKARGYRWSQDGVDAAGYPKCWYTVLRNEPEVLALEADFLRNEIYLRDVDLPAFRVRGDERYSARKPRQREHFRTADVRSVTDAIEMKAAPVEMQIGFGF